MQTLHRSLVMNRRVRVLATHLANLIPDNPSLTGLDVGCGSGEVAVAIQALRPNVTLEGVDVFVRPQTALPIREFDGKTLPYPENSFDFVMLVDVLHHTHDPKQILKECTRVAKTAVLIKDHYCNHWFDDIRLRFMDWVGNRSYGVALPYNYLSFRQWNVLFDELRWFPEVFKRKLKLYPVPFRYLFDSNLHFVTSLKAGEDLRGFESEKNSEF
ncbi:MAG: methyltransferase domain-containing protein [Cyanobacteria bacterium SID2]|nr:methyltransferase domain-containing protein [Cyanobacteria bacterium SID2]MBP0003101.1 methyltransferase domain-containing protein [Cyanobacteria bacterium SBC]